KAAGRSGRRATGSWSERRRARPALLWRGRACFDRLAEADAIAERVDHRHLPHSPFHLLEARPVVAIFFFLYLPTEVREVGHIDIRGGSRRTVAMVLAQMQHQLAAGDLHVDGSARLGAILPIDLAAEKIEVELARLFQRENPENRHHALELDCHADLSVVK